MTPKGLEKSRFEKMPSYAGRPAYDSCQETDTKKWRQKNEPLSRRHWKVYNNVLGAAGMSKDNVGHRLEQVADVGREWPPELRIEVAFLRLDDFVKTGR